MKKLNHLAHVAALLIVAFTLMACGGEAATSTTPAATPVATAVNGNTNGPAATLAATTATGSEATVVSGNTNCDMATFAQANVDKSKLSKELNLYHWSAYIDPDLLKVFETCYGVRVVLDTYGSNEELYTKIGGGVTGYDIAVPSDYMVGKLAQEGRLSAIDFANVPNGKGVDARFQKRDFDPEGKYSVAYTWGTTGIAYDSDKVQGTPDSWAIVFDPQYKGRIAMIDDSRELTGAALKSLGYSYNSTDMTQLNEAREKMIAQKPLVKAYDPNNLNNMKSGEVDIAQMYVGDALQVAVERPSVKYFIPKEGSTLWQDNMVILKDAPHKYTAEVFLNFMLDPKIAGRNTNYIQYANPIPAAREFIDAALTGNPVLFPPDDVLSKQEAIKDLGEQTELYERIYTEVKNR